MHILSIINLDWFGHAHIECGMYEWKFNEQICNKTFYKKIFRTQNDTKLTFFFCKQPHEDRELLMSGAQRLATNTLTKHFSKFGKVECIVKRKTTNSEGFVRFESAASVMKAYQAGRIVPNTKLRQFNLNRDQIYVFLPKNKEESISKQVNIAYIRS